MLFIGKKFSQTRRESLSRAGHWLDKPSAVILAPRLRGFAGSLVPSLSLSLVLLARARCNSLMLIISHASLDITMTKYVYLYGVLSRDVTRRAGCLVGRNRAVSWEKIITGGDHEREWSRERKRTIVIGNLLFWSRFANFFWRISMNFFFIKHKYKKFFLFLNLKLKFLLYSL